MMIRRALRRCFPPAAVFLALPMLLAGRGCDEPGDPGSCFCAEIYAPVCGADGNTYGNACEAECQDVRVAHEGECGASCVCPAIYAPVCGSDGATYGNDCEAACAGVMITHPGECAVSCVCPEIYAPVCGTDGNTYGNECEASCASATVVHAGPCECPGVPPIWCEWGYVVDQRGCPTPECEAPPMCPPVLCDIYCEHGHATDARGCETCACNPPPPSGCRSDADCAPGSVCDLPVCIWDDPSSPCPDTGVCVPVPHPAE